MGFGHRVYKEFDPRSRIIEPIVEKLADTPGAPPALRRCPADRQRDVAREAYFSQCRFLRGLLYHFLDIPQPLFTPLFVLSRITRLVGACFGAARRQSPDPARRGVYRPGAATVRADRRSLAMSSTVQQQPHRPDEVLAEIAAYVCGRPQIHEEAYATAQLALMDSLGCGLLALRFRLHETPRADRAGRGPPGRARVPGTSHRLDPVQAAFCIGAMVRWLDYNDTWLAAEWGHPSDNLGAILAVADWLGRPERGAT